MMGRMELIDETEKVCLYSPKYDGETYNEFEKFLLANRTQTHPQLKKFFGAILSVLEKIGETGAYERYFRPEGGNVKAVPTYIDYHGMNRKVGKMRLYCLRLSYKLLIIGNGSVTKCQKYEDDPVLSSFIRDLQTIDKQIRRLVRQAGTDFEDFDALKRIIETITI